MFEKKCKLCGKIYLSDRKQSKFCNIKCSGKWVVKNYLNKNIKFRDYNGENNPCWRGGRLKRNDGYILIYRPKHPYYNADGLYVFEHRLVIENKIGRYLTKKEKVHHINGNRSDNRIENLKLINRQSEHCRIHGFDKNGGWNKGKKMSIETRKLMSRSAKTGWDKRRRRYGNYPCTVADNI
jgi:hypothetical protein